MKYFFLSALVLVAVSSCKAKEAQLMAEELAAKRAAAAKAIASGDFSTDNLLIAQEYFFSFGEKAHLLRADQGSLKGVLKVLERSANEFCSNFVLSRALWMQLDRYCRSGDVYRCSSEMQEYPKIVTDFKVALGPEAREALSGAPACRF